MIYLIVILMFSTACGSYVKLDPAPYEVQEMAEGFYTEVDALDLPYTPVRFYIDPNLPHNINARCYLEDRRVHLSPQTLKFKAWRLRHTVYHELAHCSLGFMQHTDGGLMNASQQVEDALDALDQYEEFFTVTLVSWSTAG